MGQKLAVLRREGLLILGSGNIVHSLQSFNWHNPAVAPPWWAADFERWVRDNPASGKVEELVKLRSW